MSKRTNMAFFIDNHVEATRRLWVILLTMVLVFTAFGVRAGDRQESLRATYVTGPISVNTTWNESGSPYVLNESLEILEGIVLTILEGVEVLFNNDFLGITVHGGLAIEGSEAKSVVFRNATGSLVWNGALVEGTGYLRADNLTVTFEMYSSPFISLSGCHDSYIRDSEFSICDECIVVRDSTNITIDDVGQFSWKGTRIENSSQVSLTNSHLELGDGPALYVDSAVNLTISNNTFIYSGWKSTWSVKNSRNILIENNNVELMEAWNVVGGISFVNNSGAIYRWNDVLVHDGIFDYPFTLEIADQSNISFYGNIISSYPSFQFYLNKSNNISFTGNSFVSRDAEVLLLSVDTSGNEFHGNGFSSGSDQVRFSFSGVDGYVITGNEFHSHVLLDNNASNQTWWDECSGNWWFDYTGSDWNGDGIGELPYHMSEGLEDPLPVIIQGSCYSSTMPGIRLPPGITRLTHDSASQLDPRVYHNSVVWRDNREGAWNLYRYNLSSMTEQRLGFDAELIWGKRFDVYEDRIVHFWNDELREHQLVLNRTLTRATPGPLYDDYYGPAVFDRWIAWDESYYLENYLYAKDLVSGTTFIAGWGGHEYQIHGETIAYLADTGHVTYPGACKEIAVTNLSTGAMRQLTHYNQIGGDRCPPVYFRYNVGDVSIYEDFVVWTLWYTYWDDDLGDYVTENLGIRGFNLTSSQQWTAPMGSPRTQKWSYAHGQYVVWADDLYGDLDVVLFNRLTSEEFRLRLEGNQAHPRLHGNVLVWHDSSQGNLEIYAANLSFLLVNVEATPNPQEVGGSVTIGATVLNVLKTENVTVEVFDPGDNLLGNFTMGGTDDYEYTASYNQTGLYSFRVWAEDNRSNLISADGSFLVHDTTPPIISSVAATPSPQEVFGVVTIGADITDNHSPVQAWVNVTYPSGTWKNSTMTDVGGSRFEYMQAYDELGTHFFTVFATDVAGNWNNAQGSFLIVDVNKPMIISHSAQPSPQEMLLDVNISAVIVDDMPGVLAWVEVSYPSGNSTNSSMTRLGSSFYVTRGYEEEGNYTYTISARDVWGNWNSSSGEFVVLGPEILETPVDLEATLGGGGLHDVVLSWDFLGNDDEVVSFDVFRGDSYDSSRSDYQLIASLPRNTRGYADSGKGEGDPSEHFYSVCALDRLARISCSEEQVGKFSRQLSVGLNLVSIPLLQSDESVDSVLQTVHFDQAWSYDATIQAWRTYMKFKAYKGSLSRVDHAMGIWVNVTENSNLTVAGVVPPQTTIHLRTGWNLVSFPSFNTSFSVMDLKAEIGAIRVEGYDPAAPPNFLRVLGDAEVLRAGEAYWVKVSADMDWIAEVS